MNECPRCGRLESHTELCALQGEIERLLQDIQRHIAIASELATENEPLRAELAEAQTVKESLIVALDLFGRHSPKGKPCPVCEAIDAAMAGGEHENV